MNLPRKQHAFLALLAALLLTSCGFHLRDARSGAADIPAEAIYVDEDGAANLAEAVRARLRNAGVRAPVSAQEAQFVVLLSRESFRRDVLSVSPRTGKVEEYQVTFSSRLSLREVDGETLLDNDPLSLVRDFTFDQSEVLGKFSEEETLRDELTRDAAEQVLRRISAVLAHRK